MISHNDIHCSCQLSELHVNSHNSMITDKSLNVSFIEVLYSIICIVIVCNPPFIGEFLLLYYIIKQVFNFLYL